jgi:hypothetical protein
VPDQPALLRLPDERLVDKLREFHASELLEGSGKSRLMRHLPRLCPTAEPPQLGIPGESIQQLPGKAESVHRFSHKGAGNRQPVFRRSTDPAAAARDEARQRDHLQCRHQPFGRPGQFSQFFLQNRKESRLQYLSKLRDLLPKCKLHVGLPNALPVSQQQLTSCEPFFKQI